MPKLKSHIQRRKQTTGEKFYKKESETVERKILTLDGKLARSKKSKHRKPGWNKWTRYNGGSCDTYDSGCVEACSCGG